MTKKEAQHIEQLMMERLTGVISDSDSGYLDSLLRKDENIYLKWEKEKADFERQKLQYLKSVDAEEAWLLVKEGISLKRQRRKVRIRRSMIAVSLLLPLFFAVLFLSKKSKEGSPAPDKAMTNGIQLRIAGSQTINLSQYMPSKGLPPISNLKLKVGKGGLSYVPLNDQVSRALNTLIVPATKTYRVTLSDGTEVILNSVSSLKFPFIFSGSKREVWLEGEAYFRVAKDEVHPFIVHTSLTSIKVLGTSFNVNTYDSSTVKTALVSGLISMQADGKWEQVEPGYEAAFSHKKGFNISAFDNNTILSWLKGVYYFQDAPLKQIAPVIQRWYGKQIIFDDSEISTNRFTGALIKNKPVNDFLNNLSLTSNIHYYTKDSVIHIKNH